MKMPKFEKVNYEVEQDAILNYNDNGVRISVAEVAPVETPAKFDFGEQETPDVTDLIPIEWSAQRVLTTEQLAQFYQCSSDNIKKNFSANKDKFVKGKHYFKVEGDDLNKLRVTESDRQISPMTRTLYLWTERGAARHAKILTTEKAWEVFELLEDNYFNAVKPVETAANIKPIDLIKEIGELKDAILAVYTGAEIGSVLAQATLLISEYYHRDFSSLLQLLPPVDYDIGYLNPTEIGESLGISAQMVNVKLSNLKLQIKVGKEWHITDEGKKYGGEKFYSRNGHTGYRILWTDKVIPLLTEVPCDIPPAEEISKGIFLNFEG